MLKIIQVGHVEASDRYIRNKVRAVRDAGMEAEVINLPQESTTMEVTKALYHAMLDKKCAAVIVQLPLPEHIDTNMVFDAIPWDKDIDGLNPRSDYKPLTPSAIMRWLSEQKIPLTGKNVAILGRSNLVGKPLANMMIDAGATVTVMNSKTPIRETYRVCRDADIIVSAVGKPNTVTLDHVLTGEPQVIIDVGINRDANGNLCGDVSAPVREFFAEHGDICTPVPGGVGKWTVRELVLRLEEMEKTHVYNHMRMYTHTYGAHPK